MKYQTIYLEGIDKSGKDLIAKYVNKLSNYKYIVNSRGILSQIAYSILYNRGEQYDIEYEKNNLYVYLQVDKEDWEIRCKLSNEPEIDYKKNIESFDIAINLTKDKLNILYYDTSLLTPYEIAKKIIYKIEQLNKETK